MPLEYFKGKITRQLLRDNPDKLFLFGDNDFRHGYGGQAAEMRGEPNAIGIRTKRYPRMRYDDFWYDKTYEENTKKISEDFIVVVKALKEGKSVVIPIAGLGTGRAEMATRCPRTYSFLVSVLAHLGRI